MKNNKNKTFIDVATILFTGSIGVYLFDVELNPYAWMFFSLPLSFLLFRLYRKTGFYD